MEYMVLYNYRLNWTSNNKAYLRDLIAATDLVISNWIQIVNFPPMWPQNLMDDLEKQ